MWEGTVPHNKALQPTPLGVGAGCARHVPCGAAELYRYVVQASVVKSFNVRLSPGAIAPCTRGYIHHPYDMVGINRHLAENVFSLFLMKQSNDEDG
jgi:hypothetical protein